ncbi:MAG: cysteine peptidase family C39 domain-containing protein [Planctomycetota bacterium]
MGPPLEQPVATATRTCTPAAATTLLSYHGVETSEEQLAELCLTSEKGTHLTGLYRGLSLLAPEGHRVRVESLIVLELMGRPDALPAVVSLKLTQEIADRDPRFVQNWGWDVEVTHTVVVIGFPNEQIVAIADPGVGRETWTVRGLEELWTHEVIYLEPDG